MWEWVTGPAMSRLARRVEISGRSGVLLVGDLAAIGLFVLLGEIRHGGTLRSGAFTYAEFGAGWVIAAVAVGAYAGDALSSRGRAVALAGGGWVLGALLGQVIRSYVKPGFYVAPTFLAVTIGVGGVLLVGWRLLAAELL